MLAFSFLFFFNKLSFLGRPFEGEREDKVESFNDSINNILIFK